MNFLIISDSHGRPAHIEQALSRQIVPPDAILFLGDGRSDILRADIQGANIFCVRGNCDVTTVYDEDDFSSERLLTFDGVKIFMTHGHVYDVGYGTDRAAAAAAAEGADILLYGHTHIADDRILPAGTAVCGVLLQKPLHIFNPGSVSQPRRGCASFGTLELRRGVIITGHGEL